MGVTTKALLKIEELASLLSKVHRLDWKSLIWALKPAMLALIQHKFLEHPCVGVILPVSYFLSNIMMLTTPVPPYSDDLMRRVFRLIVETFQDLDYSEGPTFWKRLEILEVMALVRSYDLMFELKCDDFILQMFQCFFSVRKHHPDTIITHMQSILSSCMGGHDAICRKLQSHLLHMS